MTEEEENKEVALEILMTMAPILYEGVPSLSFRLEGIQQVVPYERNKGNRHGVELALLGFDCQAANRPLSPHDQLVML
jgi:hypothetical protein